MDHEQTESVQSGAGRGSFFTRAFASMRRLPAWLRIALGVLLLVLVLALGFDLVTAAPGLCDNCHEMQARSESWATSAHSGVKCVQCHQAPTAWYALPQRVVGRVGLFSRDIAAHNAGGYADPVEERSAGSAPMSDDVCLQCHSANRQATSGYRILIDHVEHAKRNGSCVSCHIRTAHPLETRSAPMSFMSQCFTCHGTPGQPKASATCGTCHPADYELLPESHADKAAWQTSHASAWESDQQQCAMCHEQSFCDGCHGVTMPHPAAWASAHSATAAEVGRDVCGRCHGAGPDLCTSCHHSWYDAAKGTWVEQHNVEVKANGSAECERCHRSAWCSYCHTSLTSD